MPCGFGIVPPIEAVVCASTASRVPIAGSEEMDDQRVAEAVSDPFQGCADEGWCILGEARGHRGGDEGGVAGVAIAVAPVEGEECVE